MLRCGVIALNAFLSRHGRVAIVLGVLVAVVVVLGASHGLISDDHGGKSAVVDAAAHCAVGICVALPLLLVLGPHPSAGGVWLFLQRRLLPPPNVPPDAARLPRRAPCAAVLCRLQT